MWIISLIWLLRLTLQANLVNTEAFSILARKLDTIWILWRKQYNFKRLTHKNKYRIKLFSQVGLCCLSEVWTCIMIHYVLIAQCWTSLSWENISILEASLLSICQRGWEAKLEITLKQPRKYIFRERGHFLPCLTLKLFRVFLDTNDSRWNHFSYTIPALPIVTEKGYQVCLISHKSQQWIIGSNCVVPMRWEFK